MSKPLISVIMPAFNVENYIDAAIQSILNQTYTNFELLICDDGSKDNTVEIIRSYNDCRIQLFRNPKNLGNLKTTNFLLSKCKGEYITIQDADDYSELNRFEILINTFNQNKHLGMIGSNYQAVSFDLTPLYCGNLPLDTLEISRICQKEVVPMLYASIMVKQELVKKVGGFSSFFNKKGYADFDWMSRIQELTQVINVKEVLYNYRRHTSSFTSKSKLKFCDVYHTLIVEMHKRRLIGKEDYFQLNNDIEIRKMISNIYLRKAIQNYWDKKKGVNRLFYKSFLAYPFNFQMIRTFLYTLRNRVRSVKKISIVL